MTIKVHHDTERGAWEGTIYKNGARFWADLANIPTYLSRKTTEIMIFPLSKRRIVDYKHPVYSACPDSVDEKTLLEHIDRFVREA